MRTRRSAERWLELVSEFKGSGQTQKEFARRHGVNAGSLWYWLRRKGCDGAVRFAEVKVGGVGEAEVGGVVEAVLAGGVILRFPPGVEARYVGAVVRAVAGEGAC